MTRKGRGDPFEDLRGPLSDALRKGPDGSTAEEKCDKLMYNFRKQGKTRVKNYIVRRRRNGRRNDYRAGGFGV